MTKKQKKNRIKALQKLNNDYELQIKKFAFLISENKAEIEQLKKEMECE